MTDFVNLFGPLDGTQIPGGCDDCEAFQTVDPVRDGIWSLTVHHDPTCPIVRRTK